MGVTCGSPSLTGASSRTEFAGGGRGHPQRLLPEDGEREPVEELVPGETGRDRHGVPGRARVVQQPVDAAQRQGLRR